MDPKVTTVEASEYLSITRQALHKRLKSSKLKYSKSQNKGWFGHTTAKEIFNIKFSPCKTVAIEIIKGGAGKTALTKAIAIKANLYGAKVLLIDLDQQGNLTEHFGIDAEDMPVMLNIVKRQVKIEDTILNISDGLHLLPSKIDNAMLDDSILFDNLSLDRVYKDQIDKLKPYYDLILIDCPPALGRSVGAAALSADLVIAPVIPDKQCLRGLALLHKHLEELATMPYGKKIPLRILYNRYDGRTNLSRKILTLLLEHPIFKNMMLNTYIRQSQDFPNAYANVCSIFDSTKPSTAKEDIDALTQEIMDITRNPPPLKKEDVSMASFESVI
jgi:chromosome partitioning protein